MSRQSEVGEKNVDHFYFRPLVKEELAKTLTNAGLGKNSAMIFVNIPMGVFGFEFLNRYDLCRHGRCVNVQGGFTCECADGFEVTEDGESCKVRHYRGRREEKGPLLKRSCS